VDHRARLVAFYEKLNPAKLDSIDATLEKYAGRESELFEALRAKYEAPAVEEKGDAPAAPAPAAAPKKKTVPPIKVEPPSPSSAGSAPSSTASRSTTKTEDTPKKKKSMWGKLRGAVRSSPRTPKTPTSPPPDKLQAAARRRSAPGVRPGQAAMPDEAASTTESAAAAAVDAAPTEAPAEATAPAPATASEGTAATDAAPAPTAEAAGDRRPPIADSGDSTDLPDEGAPMEAPGEAAATASEPAAAPIVRETPLQQEAPVAEETAAVHHKHHHKKKSSDDDEAPPPPPPPKSNSPFVEAIAKRREKEDDSPTTPQPKARGDKPVGRPSRPDPTPSPSPELEELTPFAARRRSMGASPTPTRRFLRRESSFSFDPGDVSSPRRRHSALLGQMRDVLFDSPAGSRQVSRQSSFADDADAFLKANLG